MDSWAESRWILTTGGTLGDIRSEMERLRPVYETGVLRLLMRNNSQLYVALLRSSFEPLTGELPREVLEEHFTRALSKLVETGEYTLKEFKMDESGECAWLIPHNPDFQPIRVDKNNEFTVWGVVTYAIHKTRL